MLKNYAPYQYFNILRKITERISNDYVPYCCLVLNRNVQKKLRNESVEILLAITGKLLKTFVTHGQSKIFGEFMVFKRKNYPNVVFM